MGYETYYRLNIIDGNTEETEKFWDDLYENRFGDYIRYAVGKDGESGNSCKWYEHKSDMLKISREFPTVVFELSGDGEESGDIWKEYYKNGKIQRCDARIEFDPYDENRLQ